MSLRVVEAGSFGGGTVPTNEIRTCNAGPGFQGPGKSPEIPCPERDRRRELGGTKQFCNAGALPADGSGSDSPPALALDLPTCPQASPCRSVPVQTLLGLKVVGPLKQDECFKRVQVL